MVTATEQYGASLRYRQRIFLVKYFYIYALIIYGSGCPIVVYTDPCPILNSYGRALILSWVS